MNELEAAQYRLEHRRKSEPKRTPAETIAAQAAVALADHAHLDIAAMREKDARETAEDTRAGRAALGRRALLRSPDDRHRAVAEAGEWPFVHDGNRAAVELLRRLEPGRSVYVWGRDWGTGNRVQPDR